MKSHPHPLGKYEIPILHHRQILSARARRLVHNAQDVEDLVQETLARAFGHLDQIKNPQTLTAWLFAIQRNIFLNEYARQKRMPSRIEWSDESIGGTTRRGEPADKSALARIEYRELMAAIHALPPIYREAVLLCDVEELSYQEIADRTGTPIGTIRSRISRGRKMVQQIAAPDMPVPQTSSVSHRVKTRFA